MATAAASPESRGTPDLVDDRECTVLHVDMDAFFASVELRRHSELRGRPMIVAGSIERGVVLSATYEARAHGVRSAMPTSRALALCPGVVLLPPEHRLYYDVSAALMELFADVTPIVEPLSVDEAFLDVSGAGRTGGRPRAIAVELRRRIAAELGLTASVGAASTKFVAKLASTRAKPDGLLIVPPRAVRDFLRPMPVGALWGVGPKTATRLASLGLATVAEVADTDRDVLARALGVAVGHKLHDLANGRDERSVQAREAEKSIGAESTFLVDVADLAVVRRELLQLSEKAARRARSATLAGRTVSLKVRFADFTTLTRAQTLSTPTDLGRDVYAAALRLWERLDIGGRSIRLVGVRLEGLSPRGTVTEQLELGAEPDRPGWRDAERAADLIAARFPSAAPRPATLLSPPERHPARDR